MKLPSEQEAVYYDELAGMQGQEPQVARLCATARPRRAADPDKRKHMGIKRRPKRINRLKRRRKSNVFKKKM